MNPTITISQRRNPQPMVNVKYFQPLSALQYLLLNYSLDNLFALDLHLYLIVMDYKVLPWETSRCSCCLCSKQFFFVVYRRRGQRLFICSCLIQNLCRHVCFFRWSYYGWFFWFIQFFFLKLMIRYLNNYFYFSFIYPSEASCTFFIFLHACS